MEREHLAISDSFRRQTGQHLWQRNMPNVRIAFMTSQFGCELLGETLNRVDQSRGWKFAMTDDASGRATTAPGPERKPLSPAAKRALAEAEARRQAAAADADAKPAAREFQGPQGPEPTRYGDWENKGIASDF
jgi:hypothetical protein